MKRMISCLLAALMVFVPCMQAAAPAAVFAETTDSISRPAYTGQVDVSVISALVLKKDVDFTISLTGQESKKVTLASDSGGQQPSEAAASFEGLAPGEYTLAVTAQGFAGYQQNIHVQDQAYRVKLMTGFAAGYSYTADSVHPGVILIGDADGNGSVDAADQKKIADAVDAGSYDPDADLNRDGSVDLADLEYFAKGYQENRDTASAVEISIPAAKVNAQPGGYTKIMAGDAETLLRGGDSVSLVREDGSKISQQTPVSVEFTPKDQGDTLGGIVIEADPDNPVLTAEVEVTDETDQTVTIPVKEDQTSASLRTLRTGAAEVKKTDGGVVCIDLKTQVAVKKITLRITGMAKSNDLAKISRVTFIGDMADRIPEPAADIPDGLQAEPANGSFTLTWKPCENVTGYEVWIAEMPQEPSSQQQEGEVMQVAGTTLAVESLSGNKKIENYKQYEVKVRSVNGLWRSAYSSAVIAEPKPAALPDAPDNLSAAGKYRSVQVSWKKMKDSRTYNLYYKKADADAYTKIEGIEENRYLVADLEDQAKYLFYVTGVNELGEGKPSLTASAETKTTQLAAVPRYKLLNAAENGKVSAHILQSSVGSGSMQNSPKDADAGTAWGSVDNDQDTYYQLNSWDSGGFNALGSGGLFYEFDQAYKMKTIALQEQIDQDIRYDYAQIRYWDADGQSALLDHSQIAVQKKTDAEGRVYYMLRLTSPITAKKLQIGLARGIASGTITVSEIYFYLYDSLEDDIMGLYTDDLHTVLREDVTQATIDELRTRINTKEEASGEYHPDRDMLERELKTAEDILNSKPAAPVHIHSGITTRDVSRGFGGLNAWQPLGISAAAGEELTVYVGHSQKRTGDNTQLQLVATQYHSESSPMFRAIGTLKIGRNDITIPKIWSIDDESGGAVYVQYTGGGSDDDYAVRVSGGVKVPILDLYQVTDASERTARITEYITDLETYVSQMPENHEKLHIGSENKNVQYAYNEANCILGATDIMLDTMMLSLPAPQVLKGCGGNAETLAESMQAMEDMMYLFYQHKGLNRNAEQEIDRIPKAHQNIRYQRMFAGAFMYASGNHIGIEYPEAAGMVSGKRVEADAEGKGTGSRYFGWGIAHEIGHCINQSAYAVAEITNNYFSVLAQAQDTNSSVRFKYEDVYKKVTSNTKGRSSNVFTQLGMYWQLHLAYDKGYNYKTYESHKEQLDHLFFARVDAYARDPKKAPHPKGTELTLSGDTDQNLMRLACAAAQKNNLEFFERWGMTPNADTVAYAEQFEKEDRMICYVNDEARVYQLTKANDSGTNAGVVDAVKQPSADGNTVSMQLSASNILPDDILGYEIVRCTTSGGEEKSEFAGFAVPAAGSAEVTFQDTVTAWNNRCVTYKVSVISKYLYQGAETTLAPVKICHQGYIDQSNWTIRTNDLEAVNIDQSAFDGENTELSCGVEEEAYALREFQKAIDGNPDSAFTGTAGENAEIVLEFNRSYAVTGLKYTVQSGNPIRDYRLYVRDLNGEWTEAVSGSFGTIGEHTVGFAKDTVPGNIAEYQTNAVKLVIPGQSGVEISIAELDILGIAGDNIEFLNTAGDQPGVTIGRLKTAYQYDQEDPAAAIPENAIVFVGSYRGNPAYNAVLLYDQDGSNVGGIKNGELVAHQIILADVPEEGNIQNVSDGTWVYWIDPEDADTVLEKLKNSTVRAELYRVDNAQTNEGQRLVSDTLPVSVPVDDAGELPPIEIGRQLLGQ